MTVQTLTLTQLNRTLLARQLLLERQAIQPIEAIEQLIGLQSQIPNPPYIGLWTRLASFKRNDLTQLMESKQIVRAPLMRSTLHLMTASDHQSYQPVLQPALTRALKAFYGKRAKGLDIEKLIQVTKPFIEEQPRTTGEIKAKLLEVEPEQDGDAMAYAVRNYLALVQVPPSGTWGTGTRAEYTTAELWLGHTNPSTLENLLHRYLSAFGPASIMDFQAWVGIPSLTKVITPMKESLVIYQNEDGKELLDVPDMPILDEDTPSPIRFVPDYDNLLVSHKDRNRIIADDDRKYVFLSAARVLGTVLIDGFVGATWKITQDKTMTTLSISLFQSVDKEIIEVIQLEGKYLLMFVYDDLEDYTIDMTVNTN